MKKLPTIIVLILFLSSIVSSCKQEETIYQWKTSSGLDWKTTGDKMNHPQYKGEVRRQYLFFGKYIRDGLGTLNYPDGRKYVGEWKKGKKDGLGTFKFKDGRKYSGQFKNGKRDGKGKLSFRNGEKFEGIFKNNKPWTGDGTYRYSSGEFYKGELKNGKREGFGTFIWSNGNKYEGEWKNSKPDGEGTLFYPDGKQSIGEYKNGKSWNTIGIDKFGNTLFKVENGELNSEP